MAEGHSMTVADVVAGALAGEAGDFLCQAVEFVAHELMEAEISVEIGAARGEFTCRGSVVLVHEAAEAVAALDIAAGR